MLSTEIQKTLDEVGFEIIAECIYILNQKKGATNLARNIRTDIVQTAETIMLEFIIPEYGIFVHQGRRRGSFPPLKAIEKWAIKQGIPKSAVFPIAKSIYKNGIKPVPFLDPIIHMEQRHKDKIKAAVIKELERQINEIARNSGA